MSRFGLRLPNFSRGKLHSRLRLAATSMTFFPKMDDCILKGIVMVWMAPSSWDFARTWNMAAARASPVYVNIMVIVVANRISVATGWETDFESRWKGRKYLLGQLPIFVRNEVLRSLQGNYIVKTYWETMEDFERWTRSEEF